MSFKIYKTSAGIVVQQGDNYFIANNNEWDTFVNDDNLYAKLSDTIGSFKQLSSAEFSQTKILPPIQSQEVWACGVTYYRSKVGRQEESKDSGGADFYAKVYVAERPEVFFKAVAARTVGHKDNVRIRKDSTWDVPEPELTLAVTSSGKIIGYTIGNDMSSRSIEGENPLYLPQAKMYDGSTAIGPCIYVTNEPLPSTTQISIDIHRNGSTVFEGKVNTSEIKRKFEELVSYVYREMTFKYGSLIMTGTGIVPGHDFTLRSGDVVKITIDHIGVLVNTVE